MAKVSTYLNFARNTEEAFLFYQSVCLVDRFGVKWMFNCAAKK